MRDRQARIEQGQRHQPAELVEVLREVAVERLLQLWLGERDLVAEQGTDRVERRAARDQQQGQQDCQ